MRHLTLAAQRAPRLILRLGLGLGAIYLFSLGFQEDMTSADSLAAAVAFFVGGGVLSHLVTM